MLSQHTRTHSACTSLPSLAATDCSHHPWPALLWQWNSRLRGGASCCRWIIETRPVCMPRKWITAEFRVEPLGGHGSLKIPSLKPSAAQHDTHTKFR